MNGSDVAVVEYYNLDLKRRLIAMEFTSLMLLLGIVTISLGAFFGMLGLRYADTLLALIGLVIVAYIVFLR